ncbi:hypothetical protein H012_gp435 [Acanthamoeba polyphaga moumouvirus]|uniref:Uncharacterized protein n=2 Tax=Moumouvirus TaxID=3080801 RepID=L7RBW3_9VIRU|nr:hypothetical protein H012_gp435 [Acanthamoeba polyphaga moumouvirus]AEX62694.1 hypothetical protein mv_L489 [Moumouvirus Monve]AGC02024.1 hypothetical protein Moumou_00490 [Acanthamoeba polyphaga moumouvirus]
MDSDHKSYQSYNSHIDVIKKEDIVTKNKKIMNSIKNKVTKKLDDILSKKYSFNKYYKIYPVTGRVQFVVSIIKNYLFPKDLLFLIKKEDFLVIIYVLNFTILLNIQIILKKILINA